MTVIAFAANIYCILTTEFSRRNKSRPRARGPRDHMDRKKKTSRGTGLHSRKRPCPGVGRLDLILSLPLGDFIPEWGWLSSSIKMGILLLPLSSLCPTGFLWRSKVVMHMKMVCIIIQSLYKYDSSLLLIVRREGWQRTDYPGRWCAPASGQEVCYSLVNKNKGSQIK